MCWAAVLHRQHLIVVNFLHRQNPLVVCILHGCRLLGEADHLRFAVREVMQVALDGFILSGQLQCVVVLLLCQRGQLVRLVPSFPIGQHDFPILLS